MKKASVICAINFQLWLSFVCLLKEFEKFWTLISLARNKNARAFKQKKEVIIFPDLKSTHYRYSLIRIRDFMRDRWFSTSLHA